MDPFLETFWNLDQIHGWAETRDPELVRDAALPRYGTPKKTAAIAIPVAYLPTPLLRGQRDIDAELWPQADGSRKLRTSSHRRISKNMQSNVECRSGKPIAIGTLR